jgi:hypothetical protein
VRAALFVDSVDRLQFDVMFTQANDIREVRQAMRTLCAAIGQPAPFTAAQASPIDRPTFPAGAHQSLEGAEPVNSSSC